MVSKSRTFLVDGRKRISVEIIIALAVFVSAVLFCYQKFDRTQFEGKVSQLSLGPALSMACGGNFQNYKLPSDELTRFLQAKDESIKCDQITQNEKIAASGFERAHFYLLSTVALFWFVFGTTWKSIILYCAVMYASTVMATYMLLRLWLPKAMVLCLVIVFSISPAHLPYIAWLRDYSKAPFILLLLFIVGWLAKQDRATRGAYVVAGFGGAVAGIGIGFRMDVILFVPILLLTVCLMPSAVNYGVQWKEKARVIGAFLLIFVFVGFPIIRALGGGSNMYHFALLGLTEPFSGFLGVASAQHDLGGFYNDFFIFESIAVYNKSLGFAQENLFLGGAHYDSVARQYYLQLISTFPGDVIARYLAAMLQMFLLVDARYLMSPGEYPWLQALLGVIADALPFGAVLIFSFLIIKNPRFGIYCLLLFFYIAGYPGLQFDLRHYFHLQPVFFLLYGVAALEIWRVYFLIKADDVRLAGELHKYRLEILKILGVAVIIWMALGSGLWGLRYIQQGLIQSRLPSLLPGNLNSIAFDWKEGGSKEHFLLAPIFQKEPTALDFEYWVLKYDFKHCGRKSIPLRLVYEFKDSYADFSRDVIINQGESGSYIFPSFSGVLGNARPAYGVRHFVGLEMPRESVKCISSLNTLKHLGEWPITTSIQIPDENTNWIYQKIKRYEDWELLSQSTPESRMFLKDADLNADQLSVIRQKLKLPGTIKYAYVSPGVAWVNDEAIVKGRTGSNYSYLLQLPRLQWEDESYFFVTGVVRGGGVTIGVLEGNAWKKQINIASPTSFQVAIKMPPGEYVPTIANNLTNGQKNDLTIEGFGWMSASEMRNALEK